MQAAVRCHKQTGHAENLKAQGMVDDKPTTFVQRRECFGSAGVFLEKPMLLYSTDNPSISPGRVLL
jgi:hypothetical protein